MRHAVEKNEKLAKDQLEQVKGEQLLRDAEDRKLPSMLPVR